MRRLISAAASPLLALLCLSATGAAQSPSAQFKGRSAADTPDEARLVTADIANFWRAYDRATPGNRAAVFEAEYLKQGSYGLQQFIKLRLRDASTLAKAVEAYPEFYASIRESTLRVETTQEPMRASFRKLEERYPAAVFPDVYFLIGRLSTGGTMTGKGLLIGVEMFSVTQSTPMKELTPWHRDVVRTMDILPAIVAHELIHYQQKIDFSNASLLQRALTEGSADFLAELIAGPGMNAHLHEYGGPRERELWAEFQKAMDGKDYSQWLYNGGAKRQRPADLGYFIGYKIAESYYLHAPDKRQAFKDIVTFRNAKQFLLASRYAEKFDAGKQ